MTEKNASIIGVAKGLAGMRKAYNTGKGIAGALNPLGPKGSFGLLPLAKEIAKAKAFGWVGDKWGRHTVSRANAKRPKGFFNALAFKGYRNARQQAKDLARSNSFNNGLHNVSLLASLASFLPNKIPGAQKLKSVASRVENPLTYTSLLNSGRIAALNDAKMNGIYANTGKELMKSLGAWGALGSAAYAGKRGIDYLTMPSGMTPYYPESLPYADPTVQPLPAPALAPRYPMMLQSQPSAPMPVQRASHGMYPMSI